MIEWWAQVTVTPLVKRMTVFNNGTEQTDKGKMPLGGHERPSSTVGEREASQNAQKKETKKKTSDKINNSIPTRRLTSNLWV